MFVHPHCGRTKTDLAELSHLLASCPKRADVHVLFFKPVAQSIEWLQTDLWRDASRIPDIVVASDNDGREARVFRAESSGEVVFYDGRGCLRFRGGITAAPSQPKNNPGRNAVEALLRGEPATVTQTPVFGTGLFDHSLTAAN
jgi:hypothetical protein